MGLTVIGKKEIVTNKEFGRSIKIKLIETISKLELSHYFYQ